MNIKKEYCLCKSLLWFQVSSFHFLGQHFRESQLSGLGDYIQLCVCLSARQKPFLARKKCILYNYQPSFFCGCEFVWQGAFQISRRGLSAFPNSKSYIELFFFTNIYAGDNANLKIDPSSIVRVPCHSAATSASIFLLKVYSRLSLKLSFL